MNVEYVIASHYAPTYQGGLAAYQRTLAKSLGSGLFFAVEPLYPPLPANPAPLPWPLRQWKPNALHRLTASQWPRLASHPWTLPLAIALAERSWPFPRDLRPKVVHLVDTGWHFSGFAFARWAKSIGATFTLWPAVHPGQWGDDRIDLALYQRADALFCQSQAEIAHLTARGLDPAKARLCGLPPMGLATGDATRFRERHGLGDRPVVFFLGRQSIGKGFPALLRAWERVVATCPEAVLLTAGAPESEAPPIRFPQGAWRNLGILDEQEKADAYAACTLFCLPSAHESFGIVYLEAWAYGKPVICGTAPASRELIEEGETGLWADQTPETLSSQLLRLLQSPETARRLGENGLALQRRRYTREAMLATHRAVWEEGLP